jgi:hypothetical protein
MANFLAWSFSRLNTFDECPKQLFHTQVVKKGSSERADFIQTQPMKDGNEVDDALTMRISRGTPLPEKFTPYEPIAAMVCAAPGVKLTQAKFALDQNLAPCGYSDWDRAFVRVIFDLAIINGDHAYIWDWKNGQIKISELQLKLFAAVGFKQFPELETIDTSFIWLKHGVTTDNLYQRREQPELWAEIMPLVEQIQIAFKTNYWPALPKRGKATCGWCPVNKAGLCASALTTYKGQ